MAANIFKRSRKLDRYEGRIGGVLFFSKERPDAEKEGRAVRIAAKYKYRIIKLADVIQKDAKWKEPYIPRMEFIKNLTDGEIDLDYDALTFPKVSTEKGEMCVRTKFSGELDVYEGIVAVYKIDSDKDEG